MIKIQIKSLYGSVLFEYEKENNTLKDTVIGAVKRGANLRGANLRGANLTDANLTGANLTDANLRGADLRGANLTDADLRGANLTDANLTDANLTGANLTDANLTGANLRGAGGESIKVKTFAVFTGLYDYVVIPFISESGEKYVKMGCFTRTVSDWKKDFWNNPEEFPNDGSKKSNLRLFAYKTALNWFDIIETK